MATLITILSLLTIFFGVPQTLDCPNYDKPEVYHYEAQAPVQSQVQEVVPQGNQSQSLESENG